MRWLYSKLAKKNALFFAIGPPPLRPDCFWLKGATFKVKKFGASPNLSLRKYPNPVPRNAFDPVLVTALMTAPLTRPYSAS